MAKVTDVLDFLNRCAPMERKMDFDNVGLLVGYPERNVSRVIVALDITDEVVAECREMGGELIVSHHPVIFNALKAVRNDDLTGGKIVSMIEGGISAICMHTNLDVSQGGVNDNLAAQLKLKDVYCPYPEGTEADGSAYGLMRCGYVEETDLQDFLKHVKESLRANGLRYEDAGRKVKKVAVVGGAGGSELLDAVKAGCDTYITSDVKHNVFIDAKELDINLIDAGHFPTENGIVKVLADEISAEFPELDVIISRKYTQTEKFYS